MTQLAAIVCRKCGTRNEATAEFCGGCGSFLEYTGERVDDAAPSFASPVTASPAPAIGAGGASATSPIVADPAPATTPPPATAPAGPGLPPTGSAPATGTPQGGTGAAPTRVEPAAVRPGAVQPQQPAAVKPALDQPPSRRPTDQVPRTVARTASAPAPVIVAKPGDVICRNCGTPNDPARHFCRTCGQSLATALPPKKLPWWRRIFPERQAKPLVAGTRTEQQVRVSEGGSGAGRRIMTGLTMVVGAVMAFAIIGYMFVPPVRQQVNGTIKDVQRMFVQPQHVYPTSATGKSLPAHPATLAIDKSHNLYWAGPWAKGPATLDFGFNTPTDIVALIVTPGAEDDVAGYARPKDVKFTFSDGTVLNVTLKDAALVDPQPGQGTGKVLANESFTTNARDVSGVRVDVNSVYPGKRDAVAIAEIEFFTKP